MWAVACQAPAAAPPPAALAATSGAGGSAVIPIETAGGSGNVQATMPAAGTAGTNTPTTTGGAAGEAPQLSRGHGPGSIFELTLEAPERPVQKGQYRLYVPNDVAHLNGVIVHQHGCGRSGINVANDLHWQALANRWGMALLGTEYPTLFPDGDHCDRWSHIENGSDELFVSALARLSQDSNRAELTAVPWLLWGHSGGATWSFQMTKKYASKVAALVIKSICEEDPAFEAALSGVPALLATGPDDLLQCYPITTAIFQSYRAAGGAWTYVDEPHGTHDCAKLRLLVIPYLDALLQKRLRAKPGGVELVALSDADGLLSDGKSPTFAPATAFVGDAASASWLPDVMTAQSWYQFLVERTVSDASAPAEAPRDLRVDRAAMLRWHAEPDLQSGISGFRLYRDGQLWQTLPESDEPFQSYNYGDEPEPAEPEMVLGPVEAGHSYELTSVNGAGLESVRSPALAVP